MKKFLFIFFLIIGCSTNHNAENDIDDIKFSDNLSLEEFKIKLKEYANKSPYPNIYN